MTPNEKTPANRAGAFRITQEPSPKEFFLNAIATDPR